MSMKELQKVINMISDKKLRKKVNDIVKHPILSNKSMVYTGARFSEVPASTNWHHTKSKGLLQHTLAVTKLAIRFSQVYEEVYSVKLDRDALIAAAIVHDIAKVWTYKKESEYWIDSGVTLDHSFLGTCELYARGFPEKVIHIVASHFGENGPTPPKTPEALLFHHIDNMDALMNEDAEDTIIQLFG